MEHQTPGMVYFFWPDTLHRNRRPPVCCIYMMYLLQCSTYRYQTPTELINPRINYRRYTERTRGCLLTTLRVPEGAYWLYWEYPRVLTDYTENTRGCLLTTLRGPEGAYWLHWEDWRVLTDYTKRLHWQDAYCLLRGSKGAYWLYWEDP